MEINYLEGNRLEWLMHKGLLLVLTKSRILWGRERINLLVHACHSNYLFIFFLVVLFFFLSLTLVSLYFLVYLFKFIFLSYGSHCSSPFLFTARFSFYSACRDHILLFYPLTSFVWSGCTGWPPLVRLCATPSSPDKEGYFVYLSAVAPFPATLWVLSLSLSLMACT